MEGFSSKRIALIYMLQDRKIYCLQARPCIIQPGGNFTGWGSEGVKMQFRIATDPDLKLNKQAAVTSVRTRTRLVTCFSVAITMRDRNVF